MRSMLMGMLAVVCASLIAHNALADESAIHTYWKQFKQGDVNKDVWTALDSADPYLCFIELNNSEIEILWDDVNSTLVLYINGDEITDLVMDIDAENRPVFHADWLQPTIARIHGFVDINEDGDIIIGWTQLGHMSTRFQLSNGDTVVSAAAKCRCGGTLGTVYKTCADSDCDAAGTGCRRNGPPGAADTGFCEWKATTVVTPGNPSDPVVIQN
jgi:hypothetical protein